MDKDMSCTLTMTPLTYEESKELDGKILKEYITEEESLATLIGDMIQEIIKKHC